MVRILVLLVAALAAAAAVAGQTAPVPRAPDTSGGRAPVVIDYADEYQRLVFGDSVLQILRGDVELQQDSVFFYGDTATIRNDDFVTAVGNVVILDDTVSVFADSLDYFADRRLAFLYGRVVLVNGRQKLFTESLRYDLATKRATYTSRAKLTNDTSQLSSLRGTYDVERAYADFRDSVFVVGPDFNLISDSLGFDTERQIVYFDGPTVMATPESRIYTEDGYYNITDTVGEFRQNAQVARGTQLARGDTIFYDGPADAYAISGNAYTVDGPQVARGERIDFNERTNQTVVIGDGYIRDGEREVTGDLITYDGNTKKFGSSGRVELVEGPNVVLADSIDFAEARGLARLRGHVYLRDTVAQRSIRAEAVDYREADDYVLAYGGRPIVSYVLDGDTLFASADTLLTRSVPYATAQAMRSPPSAPPDSVSAPAATPPEGSPSRQPPGVGRSDSLRVDSAQITRFDSARLAREPLAPLPVDTSLFAGPPLDSVALAFIARTDSAAVPAVAEAAEEAAEVTLPRDSLGADAPPAPDSIQLVLAYPDVRIYKSNLQATADSMAFDAIDSVITLYRDPIMWSDTSQFTGDTIDLVLRDETLDRVRLKSNALVINSPDEQFYNQIKGRGVRVDFRDGEVHRMHVRGNAESVYYILDDAKAYVGLNHVKSARMRMDFAEDGLSDIRFYDAPDGQIEPLAPVGAQPLLLEGFNWEVATRPRSREDLLVP